MDCAQPKTFNIRVSGNLLSTCHNISVDVKCKDQFVSFCLVLISCA